MGICCLRLTNVQHGKFNVHFKNGHNLLLNKNINKRQQDSLDNNLTFKLYES